MKEHQATIDFPNRFFKDWIEENYPDLIAESLGSAFGFPVDILYKTEARADPVVKKMDMKLETRRQSLAKRGIYLNPKYTFENFVVGPSNQFAQAAAQSVSGTPGKTYNPLFIYGGVGLGKTHLIHAAGNAVIDRYPNLTVLYVSSEHFTNEVVSALRHDKMGEFKEKYRNVDVLLLDDIQFIANKTATQEEFFHTFNTLYERQKQVVVSSDRPPKEITAVTEQRRVNGFELVSADAGARVFVFRCLHFDATTRSCDSYASRPGMCRDYPRALLDQPAPALFAECGYRPVATNAERLLAVIRERGLTPAQERALKKGLRLEWPEAIARLRVRLRAAKLLGHALLDQPDDDHEHGSADARAGDVSQHS